MGEYLLITMVFIASIVAKLLTSLIISSVEELILVTDYYMELGALIAVATIFCVFYISTKLSKRPKVTLSLFFRGDHSIH